MKYCFYCGEEMPDSANFCGKCGKSQERKITEIEVTQNHVINQELKHKEEEELQTADTREKQCLSNFFTADKNLKPKQNNWQIIFKTLCISLLVVILLILGIKGIKTVFADTPDKIIKNYVQAIERQDKEYLKKNAYILFQPLPPEDLKDKTNGKIIDNMIIRFLEPQKNAHCTELKIKTTEVKPRVYLADVDYTIDNGKKKSGKVLVQKNGKVDPFFLAALLKTDNNAVASNEKIRTEIMVLGKNYDDAILVNLSVFNNSSEIISLCDAKGKANSKLVTDKGEYWSNNINFFSKRELNPKEEMLVTIVFEKPQGIPRELSLGYSLSGKPGNFSSQGMFQTNFITIKINDAKWIEP